jgi:two-component system NtrC family sensor kinase
MRLKLIILTSFLFVLNFCNAQDSAVVFSTSMFNYFQKIDLGDVDGWMYKQGNDTAWKEKNINETGWQRFKPLELSGKDADKNGKMESWFRLKFKLDKGFEKVPVSLIKMGWYSGDIFLDGKYIASYGDDALYAGNSNELRWDDSAFVSLSITRQEDHVLAIHLIDKNPFANPFLLKGQLMDKGYKMFLSLAGPQSPQKYADFHKDFTWYWTIWISVCATFSLLFCFLYFQNRSEKNLLLIAGMVVTFTAAMFCSAVATQSNAFIYTPWAILLISSGLLFGVSQAIAMILFASVFKRKVNAVALLLIILMFVSSATDFYFFNKQLSTFNAAIYTFGTLYFIVPAWRKLKGAQWALVIGLIIIGFWDILYQINFVGGHYEFPFPFCYLYLTGIFLSSPVANTIYVAMRFKEILRDVQTNAQQVLQLSEEKKEQAIKQQKILEEEVARQTIELRASFENLKSTQSQLIQSEKMASLGELTAGIAHEIQNPLNFVNNFSEVNRELIEEMKSELRTGRTDDAILIANDIGDNEEKINHHGKRADAIVKGMLQHSRQTKGTKEPTDINALADEYLRLSYHGLRAKDNSFNATMKTDFD